MVNENFQYRFFFKERLFDALGVGTRSQKDVM